jgi:outer membrane protein OmpA-like peptidoglycan-associated protein
MPAQGGAFNQALHAGYVKLADASAAEYDWGSQAYFLEQKALPAAMGQEVLPDAIDSRDLPEDRVGLLTAARDRLMNVISMGGRERAAAETAEAQLGFDCWMEQQEENHQPPDIEACQKRFTAAIEAAEAALGPQAAAGPASMRRPKIDGIYMVYFDFNSAALSNEAMAKVAHAAADHRMAQPGAVVVEGHTDRAGGDAYNEALAKTRAEAVADALVGMGVPRSAIQISSYGESQPVMITEDGAKADKNRRVQITFQ